MTAIRDTLNAALALWQEVTGLDPAASSMTISQWRLRETFDELNEAIKLDPTQVTAILLLAHFAESYLAGREVSFLELLKNPAGVRAKLEKPAALQDLLGLPNVLQAREEYVEAVRAAVENYGAHEREGVLKLLALPHELAVLRRDALRSMESLTVHQFLKGQPEPEHIKPVYNKAVHQFWNINSLLASATRMPSGVSLNLIRHPQALQSYFCFVVRNGANLFVVTDVPDDAHPLHAAMARRPDRDLDRRARRNWFPYDLLNLEYDEDSDRLFEAQTKVRDIVAYQNDALPLVQISELQPPVLVWLTMMFDLLVERFWHEGWQAPQLSYTAEMLKSNPLMVAAETSDLLPAINYTPIALAPLTRADVMASGVTEAEVGDMCDHPHAWMEERYASQVPDSVLNLLAPPEAQMLLGENGDVESIATKTYRSVPADMRGSLREGRRELDKVDATTFGSREKLQADRKFIARANYATHISVLAHREYENRKDEVRGWFQERVAANLDTILTWAGNTDLWVDEGLGGGFSGYERGAGPQFCGTDAAGRNFVEHYSAEDRDRASQYIGIFTVGQRSYQRYPNCVVNDTKASQFVVFSPANAHELALLAGCEVADLPDVLQHWSLARPYRGNSILDRIDPMVWRAKNPWLKLHLRVRIPLSKRALAKLLKAPIAEPALLNRCAKPTRN